jgi:hypothetical protein
MLSRKSIALALAAALMAAGPLSVAQTAFAQTEAPDAVKRAGPTPSTPTAAPAANGSALGSPEPIAATPQPVTGSSMGSFSSTPEATIGSAPATVSSAPSVTPPAVLGPVPTSPGAGGAAMGPCPPGSVRYPC